MISLTRHIISILHIASYLLETASSIAVNVCCYRSQRLRRFYMWHKRSTLNSNRADSLCPAIAYLIESHFLPIHFLLPYFYDDVV
jgi:hypothetical protein